jgi:hypothetical protein
MSSMSQELGGEHHPDAVDVGQAGSGGSDSSRDLSFIDLDLLVEAPQVGQ